MSNILGIFRNRLRKKNDCIFQLSANYTKLYLTLIAIIRLIAKVAIPTFNACFLEPLLLVYDKFIVGHNCVPSVFV